jgi:hypothetical protein
MAIKTIVIDRRVDLLDMQVILVDLSVLTLVGRPERRLYVLE